MGCFDSLYVKCPECDNELEFQSKSGICCQYSYTKSNIPIDVAIGINDDIVRCDFCKSRIKLICKIPKKTNIKLINMGKRNKYDYHGNYAEDKEVAP